MKRALTILATVAALLAPGVVLRLGGAQLGGDRSPVREGNEHPVGPRGGERPRPLRGPGRVPFPGVAESLSGAACDPAFAHDISPLLAGPGTGTWTTVSSDCSARPGCDDYFHIECTPGSIVRATFCHHGGSATWNTGLSAWEPNHQTLLFCDDDTCGLQSDMVWNVPSQGFHHVRIGGVAGESGPYTLAVNIPTNCTVHVVIPVELQSFTVE